MKIKSICAVALCVASLGLVSSCSPYEKGGYHHGYVVIACDATFQPILEEEIEVFQGNYSGSNILDLYVDEGAAIDSLMNMDNSVRMACTSRPLNKKEIEYLKKNKRTVNQEAIAVDAVALIVNPENPMDFIDNQDLIDILTGKFTTWDKIVPGGKSLGNIVVVVDHPKSSATRFITDSILNGAPFDLNVVKLSPQKTPRDVINTVAKDKSAIGVIGLSWLTSDLSGSTLTEAEIAELKNMKDTVEITVSNKINTPYDVKVLAVQPKDKIQTYKPTQENIYWGNYPYYRQIYLISTCSPSTVGHSFYTFVTSAKGQKIIQLTGICPKMIIPRNVEIEY